MTHSCHHVDRKSSLVVEICSHMELMSALFCMKFGILTLPFLPVHDAAAMVILIFFLIFKYYQALGNRTSLTAPSPLSG